MWRDVPRVSIASSRRDRRPRAALRFSRAENSVTNSFGTKESWWVVGTGAGD